MSNGFLYYAAAILVYFGTWLIATWGFDLQFGHTRVVNLGFIASQAAGAYIAGVLSIGPSNASGSYILGATLAFPLPILFGAIAGIVISALIGLVTLARLRDEHFAIVTLVISVGMVTIVSSYTPLFNGDAGIAGIPVPPSNSLVATVSQYWAFVVVVAVGAVIAFLVTRQISRSPLARQLHAIREDTVAAEAVGIATRRKRLMIMCVGGGLGGLSGALLIEGIGAWNTSSWQIFEILVLLAAVAIGGAGRMAGVILGVALVPILIAQGVTFLPIGNSQISQNLEFVIISVVEIVVLWVRPMGILPEKRNIRAIPLDLETPQVLSRTVHEPPVARNSEVIKVSSSGVAPNYRVESAPTNGHGPRPRAVALTVDDVTVRFGGVEALRHCSFTVTADSTAIIGPNGAGKSTLLATISGAVKATTGRILLGDEELRGPVHQRVTAGVVRTFQLPHEFGHMTVLENLMVAQQSQPGTNLAQALIGARAWRRTEDAVEARAWETIRWLGLIRVVNNYAETLSGGQKKLLELGRALMCDPKILLLDEPFAGVAGELAERLASRLAELANSSMRLIIVEHEMKWVEVLKSDVVVMAMGTMLARGSLSHIREMEDVKDAYLGRMHEGAMR